MRTLLRRLEEAWREGQDYDTMATVRTDVAPHQPEKKIIDSDDKPEAMSRRFLGMLKGIAVAAKPPKASYLPGGGIAVRCPYEAEVAGKVVRFWVQVGDVNAEGNVRLTAYADEPYGALAKGEEYKSVKQALEKAAAAVRRALGKA